MNSSWWKVSVNTRITWPSFSFCLQRNLSKRGINSLFWLEETRERERKNKRLLLTEIKPNNRDRDVDEHSCWCVPAKKKNEKFYCTHTRLHVCLSCVAGGPRKPQLCFYEAPVLLLWLHWNVFAQMFSSVQIQEVSKDHSGCLLPSWDDREYLWKSALGSWTQLGKESGLSCHPFRERCN